MYDGNAKFVARITLVKGVPSMAFMLDIDIPEDIHVEPYGYDSTSRPLATRCCHEEGVSTL